MLRHVHAKDYGRLRIASGHILGRFGCDIFLDAVLYYGHHVNRLDGNLRRRHLGINNVHALAYVLLDSLDLLPHRLIWHSRRFRPRSEKGPQVLLGQGVPFLLLVGLYRCSRPHYSRVLCSTGSCSLRVNHLGYSADVSLDRV